MTERSVQPDINTAQVSGLLLSAPEFSHVAANRRFYTCTLAVPRLSGTEDVLRVIVPETAAAFAAQNRVEITGSVRSRNTQENEKFRLHIALHAAKIHPWNEEEYENRIVLTGAICKPPVYRTTPLGREVCDIMLAVKRPYGRADFLPLIAWGRNAVTAGQYQVGDRIYCEGRFQSRMYIKQTDAGAEERTAFEISLSAIRRDDGIYQNSDT